MVPNTKEELDKRRKNLNRADCSHPLGYRIYAFPEDIADYNCKGAPAEKVEWCVACSSMRTSRKSKQKNHADIVEEWTSTWDHRLRWTLGGCISKLYMPEIPPLTDEQERRDVADHFRVDKDSGVREDRSQRTESRHHEFSQSYECSWDEMQRPNIVLRNILHKHFRFARHRNGKYVLRTFVQIHNDLIGSDQQVSDIAPKTITPNKFEIMWNWNSPLVPLRQWICDKCGEVIESPEDGCVIWYVVVYDGNDECPTKTTIDFSRHFRIVHRNKPGTKESECRSCEEDVEDHYERLYIPAWGNPRNTNCTVEKEPLERFLGSSGMMMLLDLFSHNDYQLIQSGGDEDKLDYLYGAQDVGILMRRLHVPYYEEARHYFSDPWVEYQYPNYRYSSCSFDPVELAHIVHRCRDVDIDLDAVKEQYG